MKIIFSLIAGMMLGIAQISTKYLLITGLRNSFNIVFLVFILYLFSALIWLNLLKNNSEIGLLYGILILGSLSSILIGNQVLDKSNNIIQTKEILGVFLISIGCYLIK